MSEQQAAAQQAESSRQWSSEIKELGEKIMSLTLLQAKELGDYLRIEHGIEPAAGAVAVAAAAPAGGAAPAEEEKTDFDVILKSVGDKKIQVIKVVRQVLPGLGLKEAKDLVESAPKPIKEGVPKEEAEQIKKQLEEAGAVVEIS